MSELKVFMDELKIDVSKVRFQALVPSLKKSMLTVLADHARKQGMGQKPDGSAQKENSAEYKKRKASPGIKVGARRLSGGTPTILSGELNSSRQVVVKHDEIQGVFAGQDNNKKARGLHAKGYNVMAFSQQNLDMINKNAAKDLDLGAAITVTRKA